MPSQKYENQNPYTNQNPYAYEDPYVVHTVPPVQPVRAKQTIPIVTILIIVANVIAAIMCIGIENTFQLAGINYEYITINHEYRRLISYMFIHADFEHLIGNMVALFLFGKLVEQRLGSLRMAIIYLVPALEQDSSRWRLHTSCIRRVHGLPRARPGLSSELYVQQCSSRLWDGRMPSGRI